jgi:hypothetical protein
MGARATKVGEELGLVAPGVFEGVGEHGEPRAVQRAGGQRPSLVGRPGQPPHEAAVAGEPARVDDRRTERSQEVVEEGDLGLLFGLAVFGGRGRPVGDAAGGPKKAPSAVARMAAAAWAGLQEGSGVAARTWAAWAPAVSARNASTLALPSANSSARSTA